MRARDNANAAFCAENLLKTFKKEVPYSRNKGIDHSVLDLPAEEIEVELAEQADLCLEEYEPRISANDVNVDIINQNGSYTYKVLVEV